MDLLPIQYRDILSDSGSNAGQLSFLPDCYPTDKNIIITGPKRFRKTTAFELAIFRLLDTSISPFLAVYFGPDQKICSEKAVYWNRVFSSLNIDVIGLTDDSIPIQDTPKNHLITSTFEMWDSMTRKKWKDNQLILSSIRLVMVDDIHLLNDLHRGALLETVISQIRFLSKTTSLRFLVTCANISNAQDLSEWLGGAFNTRICNIPESLRPISLETHVQGFPSNKTFSDYQFDMHLTLKLEQCLRQFRDPSKPTLIYCSTRKSVESTAQHLSKVFMSSKLLDLSQLREIKAVEHRLQQPRLQEMIQTGVAYYHTGLSSEDKKTVEMLFKNGNLPILVSCNGFNGQAYLVILKSTTMFRFGSEPTEYSNMDLLNMVEGAGRVGTDAKGVAVVLTQSQRVEKYKKLIEGTSEMESNLYENLVDHFNLEIVLETISNLWDATNWLRSTFFCIRAIRRNNINPSRSVVDSGGAAAAAAEKFSSIEKCLRNATDRLPILGYCIDAIKTLEEHRFIRWIRVVETEDVNMDQETFTSTPYGHLYAKHHCSMESMRLLYQINGSETTTLGELLDIVCHMHEFQCFKLRATDRKVLNELNEGTTVEKSTNCGGAIVVGKSKSVVNRLRFPLPGQVTTVPMKISCLLQAKLGNLTVADAVLAQETAKVLDLALRLVRCLFEFARIRAVEEGEDYFQVLVNSLTLLKCLEVRMWDNSAAMLSQLPKIGRVSVRSLAAAGIGTFEQLAAASPGDIEKILKRAAPFGTDIHGLVQQLPTYLVTLQKLPWIGGGATDDDGETSACNDHDSRYTQLQQRPHAAVNSSYIKVNVKQLNREYDEHSFNDEISLIVGDAKTNQVLFYQENLQLTMKGKLSVDFKLAVGSTPTTLIVANLIHHSIVGLDQRKILTVNVGRENVTDVRPTLEEVHNNTGGSGDTFKRGPVPNGLFNLAKPKKVAKVDLGGFRIEDILNNNDDKLEGEETQQKDILTGQKSLLSMSEARNQWIASNAVQNIDHVLKQITGKQTSIVTKVSFKDILNTKEPEEKKGRVELFENLKIFFD